MRSEKKTICGNANSEDITKEELNREWQLVKQTAKSSLKNKDRKATGKNVRYIYDYLPDLTRGKIYEVFEEDAETDGVIDDKNNGVYKYGKVCFKEVSEVELEMNEKDVEIRPLP